MNRYLTGGVFLLICLLLVSSASAQDLGKVTGLLQTSKVEQCRGMVSLWPTDDRSVAEPERFNTIPPAVADLKPDCSFVIEAIPGNYFLRGVVRNSSGPSWGPLRPGDLVFMSPDAEGKALQVELKPAMPVNVGTHSSSWVFGGFSEQIETGVSGQVVDPDGQPIPGLVVLAFGDPLLVSQLLAAAPPTDDDGRFTLRLEKGMNIYLQAREQIGIGLPQVGSQYGVYGGKSVELVRVKEGQRLQGIKIVASPLKMENSEGK